MKGDQLLNGGLNAGFSLCNSVSLCPGQASTEGSGLKTTRGVELSRLKRSEESFGFSFTYSLRTPPPH